MDEREREPGAASRDVLEAVEFTAVEDPPRPGIVAELDRVAVNGGCELVAIDVVDPRGALDDPDEHVHVVVSARPFLHAVLQSEAANEAIPALSTRSGFGGHDGEPSFEWFHPLTIDGHVAWLLVRGGAYERWERPQAEAKELGRAFVETLFGDRYEDVTARHSTDQWSDWFETVPHWDDTLYCYDAREKRIWVLLFSDTD